MKIAPFPSTLNLPEKNVTTNSFVNYYDVLEASCNASFETIEHTFRYLAKRFHPDSSQHGDRQRFSEIVEAYDVLRDPEKRAAYDETFQNHTSEETAAVRDAGHASSDTQDRHRLLTLFYAQRRANFKNPGIGIATIEEKMGIPLEVLEFHIWFFREKGWINREESGTLSITAEGVDKIEATVQKQEETATLMRITASRDSIANESGE